MYAFMPKCYWLPFWAGSCSPLLFLIELGAAMSVASISGPLLSYRPLRLRSVQSAVTAGAVTGRRSAVNNIKILSPLSDE